jgi:hypothetical protein
VDAQIAVSNLLETQQYGECPLEVRNTGHYHAGYVQVFVEKWDTLIDRGAPPRSMR